MTEPSTPDVPARTMLPLECRHCEVQAMLVTGRLWNYLAAAEVTDTPFEVLLACIPQVLE